MKKYLFKEKVGPTLIEEMVDATVHGIGFLLSIGALISLVMVSTDLGDMRKMISSVIYGSTLVIAYLSSTLYHSVLKPKLKRFLHRLDHISIYLLIAGTYTPICLISLQNTNYGEYLFIAIWTFAVAGIILKLFYFQRYHMLSITSYLLMGWLAIFAAKHILHALPIPAIEWLVSGGLFYSLGIIFFLWERLRFSHTLWHFFVLGGSICHFYAILLYVMPATANT